MRKIERHPSNQGSVITFDMYGTEVNLFVVDAKYRATKKWGTFGTNIPLLDDFTDDGNKYLNPSNAADNENQPLLYDLDDTQLQIKFPSFKADKTAKENTDILMRYKSTEAAHWCRYQRISGVGYLDLPNLYELMVIYLEADRIDALDPTANLYKQYALGQLNPNGRFIFNKKSVCFWASTEHSRVFARAVIFNGFVNYYYKDSDGGVVPVKEL